MKKIFSLLSVSVMVFCLAACGNGNTGDNATAAETLSESEAETQAALEAAAANVQIKDTEEFEKELGISIDADMLYSEAEMYIVDKKTAECRFTFEDMGGNPVQCTLRATKDEETGENLAGVEDVELIEDTGRTVNTPDGTISISLDYTASGDGLIYTWQVGDTWYSLTMLGFPNEMERTDVLDSCLLATGVEIVEDTAVEEEVTEELQEYELSEDKTVLTVRFEANPTTGYEWTYKIWDEGTLELITSEYQQTPGTEGMAGAGGTWTASFKSVDGHNNYGYPTSNYIEFTYARQWEEGSMPGKVVDLNIVGAELEIVGIHEPDLSVDTAPDGTYDVTLRFTDMIEKDDLTHYALVGIPVKIVIPDEKVQALKEGDVIQLSEYGGEDYEVAVEQLEKTSETRIVLSDFESLSYDADLGGWVVVGPDDDIYSYTGATYKVCITNETKINDGMEEVMKTGNSGTIYDKMRSYINVNAQITVKDGWVSEITIYYHP